MHPAAIRNARRRRHRAVISATVPWHSNETRMTASLPVFDDVIAAAERIAPWAVRTPLLESALLNQRSGMRVFFKPEPLQRTGSFKFRGATNAISRYRWKSAPAAWVAFSSGNHAQGVAAAARWAGIRATIVMPKDAPAPRSKARGGWARRSCSTTG